MESSAHIDASSVQADDRVVRTRSTFDPANHVAVITFDNQPPMIVSEAKSVAQHPPNCLVQGSANYPVSRELSGRHIESFAVGRDGHAVDAGVVAPRPFCGSSQQVILQYGPVSIRPTVPSETDIKHRVGGADCDAAYPSNSGQVDLVDEPEAVILIIDIDALIRKNVLVA